MLEMHWLELCWTDTAIEVGSTVGVLVGHYGFWSLNPCRIAYVLEEGGRVEKFGFAYGTLPGHAEIGEERFSVEFDPRDSSVWYDLHAFSAGSDGEDGLSFGSGVAKKIREGFDGGDSAGGGVK